MTNIVLNKSDLKILSEKINKTTSDIIIHSAKNCRASTVQNQMTSFARTKVKGSSVISIGQDQESNINFSCVQMDQVKNRVAHKVGNEFTTLLKTKFDTKTLGTIIKNASDKKFIKVPDTNLNSKTTINNIMNKQLTDSIVTEAKITFKSSQIQDCVSSSIQNQSVYATDMTIGQDFRANINQKQVAKLIASCKQITTMASKTIHDIASKLGIKIEEKVKTSAGTVGNKSKQPTVSPSTKKILKKQRKKEQDKFWIRIGILGGFILVVLSLIVLIYSMTGDNKDTNNTNNKR
jgi:hypothetical protein